jgi:Tfp pilus assembly protein PilZ
MLVFALLLMPVTQLSAQQITGHFYPEKQQYLVGEPIFMIFELVNNSAKTVVIDETDCAWLFPQRFEVRPLMQRAARKCS